MEQKNHIPEHGKGRRGKDEGWQWGTSEHTSPTSYVSALSERFRLVFSLRCCFRDLQETDWLYPVLA